MKKYGNIIAFFITIAAFLTIWGGIALHRQSQTFALLEVEVVRHNGTFILDESDVLQAVYNIGIGVEGQPISFVETNRIKNAVELLPEVKDAEIYTTVDNKLVIRAFQKTPIARVVPESGAHFFLDDLGKTLSISQKYPQRLPVFAGKMNWKTAEQKEKILQEVKNIADQLQADEFLKAQTEHVRRDSNGDYVIIPRVGNCDIVLGGAENLPEKTNKLKAFYKAVVNKKSLNKITAINLKYKDQVVCAERQF